MKNTFKMMTVTAAAALTLSLTGQSFASAAAFKDLNNVPDKDKIIALQNSGLIKGISADLFGPDLSITAAQGVQMIVSALDLNLNAIRFVKEPHATDYFKNANDSAWYAQALIIAGVHGLDLPADLKPGEKLTREEFTYQLIDAIENTNRLPMIKPVVVEYADQDQVKVEYSGAIQRALNYGVLKLDASGKLNPKQEITRAEAAVAISNALAYLKAHPATEATDEVLTAEQAVQVIKEAVGPEASLQIKIDPNMSVTRESFTTLLINTLQSSGQLPMIKLIPVEIKDNDQIELSNSGAIQTALALKIVKLDEDGRFRPQDGVTSADAAAMVSQVKAILSGKSAK